MIEADHGKVKEQRGKLMPPTSSRLKDRRRYDVTRATMAMGETRVTGGWQPRSAVYYTQHQRILPEGIQRWLQKGDGFSCSISVIHIVSVASQLGLIQHRNLRCLLFPASFISIKPNPPHPTPQDALLPPHAYPRCLHLRYPLPPLTTSHI